MSELLPCPFCGVTPEVLHGTSHGFFVSCENRDCAQRPENTFNSETSEQAAERWNTRPAALQPAEALAP